MRLASSRLASSAVIALLAASFGGAAFAQTGPVIVVPGRPGVPVMIDGVDVSGAVVYGDWGLARPTGQIIIEGPVSFVGPENAGGYYPSAGHAPRYGRLEVEPPPQRRARPSTEYSRTWSTGSDTTQPVTQYPPFNPPPVIMAPREPHRRRQQHAPGHH
jgi:hypothetical protein